MPHDPSSNQRSMIFLDRDGTVNVDHGYVYRIPDWRFLDGSIEALILLKSHGHALSIATNQSGIARGMYTADDVAILHHHMCEQLAESDITLDAIAICPHQPGDQCDCRKPAPGLAEQIQRTVAFPIDLSRSWMIGDRITDVEFGRAIGVRTALIHSHYWSADQTSATLADIQCDSLLQAAQAIVACSDQT
jgi:D-glycero-D-manno-heptose 1,7-bisphosphate phosphatase